MPENETLTGGCQCGAVRFATRLIGRASICHCRMCQKAFGSFFGPLVTSHDAHWTRGEPKWFQSSNRARRAFCGECGTPLAYETIYGLELAIGAELQQRLATDAGDRPHGRRARERRQQQAAEQHQCRPARFRRKA